MCAIQVALCLLTGSLEMSVFQTLFAGNIWQLGAPGTGGPLGVAVRVTAAAGAVPEATGTPARINGSHVKAATALTQNPKRDPRSRSILGISAPVAGP